MLVVSAEFEAELSQMEEADRGEFLADMGLTEGAGARVVQVCFSALDLICFLTVGEDEVRAWPVRRGSSALETAGAIHSDIQRGFIRAETVGYDDFMAAGDMKAAKAAGKVRLEGKGYEVKDGDIISFRFNV